MLEIKGKISDLFLEEPSDSILFSMINSPLVQDNKCIGIIKQVDKEKNEWQGYLFDAKVILF